MHTSVGRVRVVDYDAPWLPPRMFATPADVPADPWKYLCAGEVPIEDIPLDSERLEELLDYGVSHFLCTREKGHDDGIHVCHHWHEHTHEPDVAVVWGGE